MDDQQQPVQGTSSIRRKSTAFTRAAVAASLLLNLGGFQDGPLPTQPDTYTQQPVGILAWKGLKTWPASLSVAAGQDVVPPNQENTWNEPIVGTRSLAREAAAARRSAVVTQALRANVAEVLFTEPGPPPPIGTTLLGATQRVYAKRAIATLPSRLRTAVDESGPLDVQPDTFVSPIAGVSSLATLARASTRRVVSTVPLRSGVNDSPPAIPEIDTFTQEVVGVRAWKGLRAWPASLGIAAGQDVAPTNQESTWTAPVIGTRALELGRRLAWRTAAVTIPWRCSAGGEDPILDCSSWQSPVFHPAQYQNLVWLLWYRAGGFEETLPPQEPATPWTQGIQGLSGLRQLADRRWARAAASSSLRAYRADDPLFPPPEESTWAQPIVGTGALRSHSRAAAARSAIAAAYLHTTAQDLDGPVAPQEITWTQPTPGARSLEATRRAAQGIVGSTLAIRGASPDVPLVVPPEEPTWTQQPIPGTTSLRTLQRAHWQRAARVWPYGEVTDGPIAEQPDTYAQPTVGTMSLRALARSIAARASASFSLRAAVESVSAPEPDTWQPPTPGTRSLQQYARLRWATAARVWPWGSAEDGPLPTQPETWVSPVVGTRALRDRLAALWQRARQFAPWGSDDLFVESPPAIDRLAAADTVIDRLAQGPEV